MLLSNQLIWALRDHAKMREAKPHAPRMADLALETDLAQLELNRTSQDKFDRPVPIRVRINKETGEIVR